MKTDLRKKICWQGKLQPTITLPLTQPEALTAAQVRRVVEHFMDTGLSAHSSAGATLWALLDYLQGTRVPYALLAHPGEGYEVRRVYPLAGPTA